MKKNLRTILLSLFFVFSLVFSPFVNTKIVANTVNAAEVSDVEINLAEYLTLSDGSRVDETFSTPADMVNIIVRVVFLIAGVILFIMIIVAGFNMITGANKQDLEKSKKTISGAALGFIAMFAAYWIMQLLSMITGANIGF